MKKFVSIFFLVLTKCMAAVTEITPIPLNSKMLRAIDGNTRLVKMGDIVGFQKKIHDILERKMPTKKMPDCTFQLLVGMEHKLPVKERDAILQKFIHQFALMMQHSIFDDLKMVQSEVNKIIKEWSNVRSRPATPLLIFDTKEYQLNREEGLKHYIIRLADFNILLEDLYIFLEDLIATLPKSYALYKERLVERGL
jgi:hypothetical protein